MERIQTAPNEKQPDARPVFRWLAGLTCPVFLLMAVITAYPPLVGWDDESNLFIAVVFFWGAIFFGSIAATGKFETGGKQRLQLFLAAKKYVDGQITLEEYGSRTKEIYDDH